MTRFYYLIKDLTDCEVIVYNVKVDNQSRHNVLLCKLLGLCRDEGYYINIRNSVSTEFVRNLMSNYNVVIRTISIIDMCKMCLPGSVNKSKANNYKPLDFQ